ncbi:MAG: VCBS domain-containing protein [Paraglaciecola sp.]|nr:VCBS domain-containing protein [Paraglaciecola sp.]
MPFYKLVMPIDGLNLKLLDYNKRQFKERHTMNKLKVFTLCALSAAVISSCGDDKARTLNADDNRTGSVSITANATTIIEGVEFTASVSDDDGITSEIRYQWNANGFPITGATSAIYVVSNTYAGTTLSVSAVYSDDAGFTETLISESSSEVIPLTSFSSLTESTTNDIADLAGSVTLVGDNVTVVPSDQTTTYGTFSIDENGDWVYVLNTSDATIASLDSDTTVNDEIVVEASDGTMGLLSIVITGAVVVEVPNAQVAVIRDTDSSDTGELRYKFDAPMLSGKLVASFNKDDNAVEINDELASKDAYITFYNDSGSTSSGRAIADLRIHAADFELRDQDFDVTNVFTPGAWHDVEVTWEAANDVTPPMVTVKINGVSVTAEAFSAPDAAIGGVAAIAFRFADNTAILPDDITYKVDDISIYSDVAGTTLVHEDDFERYSNGTDLDPDNNNASVYNSSTFQAVVASNNANDSADNSAGGSIDDSAGDSTDEGTGNKIAAITDTDSSDSGELRYRFESPLLAGKLVVSFNKPADAIEINDELAAKDAYITLFNSAHSTSSGRAIADLRIQTDKFILRDQDDIVVSNPFTPGEWQNVEITWEAANDVTPPMVTVTIDGVSVTAEAFSSPDAAVGGVSAIAFRFADNTAIVPEDISFKVDDISIYSDVAGTALVHEDDFESYSNGTDLDPDNNSDSVYNSSTFQAVVITEQ